MILHTNIEALKFDKKSLSKEENEFFLNFLRSCREKEIHIFRLDNKDEYNQKEFYLTFKDKNEKLDQCIDMLISTIDEYSIENKTEEEVINIINKYFDTIPSDKFNEMTRRNITLSSFFYTVERRHSALARKARAVTYKRLKK